MNSDLRFVLVLGAILVGASVFSVFVIDGGRWAIMRWRRWRNRDREGSW